MSETTHGDDGADAEHYCSETVKVTLPDRVSPTDERLDGANVTVEYNSNYNGRGETVTTTGTAELVGYGDHFTDTRLVVGNRRVSSSGHVFANNGRHIGTDATLTVTIDRDDAVDMVTSDMEYDVDDGGNGEIVVQAWDGSVIETRGFIAGTDERRLEVV